jgi:ATP dependent DNA ligase domain
MDARSSKWCLADRRTDSTVDGGVAIYDQELRSRFEWLCEPDPDAVATPPLFMAFDLLYHDRRDLTGRPLRDRRARLENVVAGSDLVFPVRRLAPDGLEAWKQVIERGYEGYVAKDESQRVRGRGDEAVVEGEAARLDGRGGPLPAADQRVGGSTMNHWRVARRGAISCSARAPRHGSRRAA